MFLPHKYFLCLLINIYLKTAYIYVCECSWCPSVRLWNWSYRGFKSPCGLLIMKVRSAGQPCVLDLCTFSPAPSSQVLKMLIRAVISNIQRTAQILLCKVTFLISNTKLSEVYLGIWCSCVIVPY